MSKRKWRRGPHILSLDELARQKVAVGEKGVVFYAMPAGITTRFSDEEVIRAERRLRTSPMLEGRIELMRLLNAYDRGCGDVDDVIDRYEGGPAL